MKDKEKNTKSSPSQKVDRLQKKQESDWYQACQKQHNTRRS